MKRPQLPASRQSSVDDSLIPMINIVFLLLIFFMIAGQFMLPVAAGVEAPKSSALQPLELSETVISQDRSGALFLNGEAIEDLGAALTAKAIDKNSALLLVVARDMEARHLDGLMRELQSRGVVKMRLVTEEQS